MEETLSVLIIDDNTKNLQILADILQSNNYKVAMVKDGYKGLEFLKKLNPDLVLLDIMMPGIDGFEVCTKIKAIDKTKDIPVIFISALTDSSDIVKGFECGGVDYITKPFKKEEVLARVKTHLELKRSKEKLQLAYQQLQAAYEELKLAARTDPLTKLSNRRDIIEKMEYEKTRFERSNIAFTLILSDIDDFKQFNDKFGHDCGDFVLTSVADVIRSRVRKQDTTARWGGEEFLILLPETDLEGGKILAEAIHDKLSHHQFHYKGQDLRISMTFGVSIHVKGETIDDTIKKADQALFRGKKDGKNRIVVSDDPIGQHGSCWNVQHD